MNRSVAARAVLCAAFVFFTLRLGRLQLAPLYIHTGQRPLHATAVCFRAQSVGLQPLIRTPSQSIRVWTYCRAAPEVLEAMQGNRSDGRRSGTTIGPAADGALIAAQICAVCLFASKLLPYIISFAVPCACLCWSVSTHTAALSGWTVKYAMRHGKQCPGILETVCLQAVNGGCHSQVLCAVQFGAAVCCCMASYFPTTRCAKQAHAKSKWPGMLCRGLLHVKCVFLEV